MIYTGILFAILSPAVYSVVNYFDKFFLERYRIEPVVIAIFSGFIALCTSLVLIVIFGFHLFSFSVTLAIIFSGLLTEFYILPYFKALFLEDASTIIPLTQFVPLFVILGDLFILGEKMTNTQYIGACLIIISGLALSLERVNTRVFRLRKSFWYMMVACLFIALAILFFKFGVGNQNFWYILPYEGMGIFLGAVCLLLLPQYKRMFVKYNKKLPTHVYGLMVINEALFITARYFSFFALSLVSASIVGALAGTQPLFVLIYGVILSLWFPFILKEVITKRTFIIKLTSVIFILIGVILLTF
jgi:drug/metabolite transporter (DMT)-like permease